MDNSIKNSLYCEKYRPQNINAYIGNEGVKSFVSKCIEEKDIPHLLLYGKPGTGKTTLAKILVNSIDCDYIYINASDERGIDTIRDKVVAFASVDGFSPLKVIILDEADQITPLALGALRNIMETYSEKTRFILTANYVDKIIEPVKSRCQSFQIEPPSKQDIARRISEILDEEKIEYELSPIVSIVKRYYPDIRKMLNEVQKNVRMNGSLDEENTKLDSSELVDDIMENLKNKTSKSWSNIRQSVANNDNIDYSAIMSVIANRASEFCASEPEVYIHAAQYMWQHNTIADRELNFCAFISQILKIK